MTPNRYRRSPDETKQCLLDAGERVLLQQASSDRLNLKLTEACKEAGFSTGAAYAHWTSQDEYRQELAEHMLAKLRSGPEIILPDLIDLTAYGFTDFGTDIMPLASQAATGVRLQFGGGDVVFIEDMLLADLDAGDFILS